MLHPPTAPQTVTREAFHVLTRSLVNLPVTHTWRGRGSTIILELGALSYVRTNNPKGEATVMLALSPWRVERPRSVAFGSGSGERKIDHGLRTLVGRHVLDLTLEGRLPELVVALSGGLWVRNFVNYEGQPGWTLFLPDETCVFTERGVLQRRPCSQS
jgi:hypothetical protein